MYNNIKEMLFNFMAGDFALQDFESWLYCDNKVEEYFGGDDYLSLISLDYSCAKVRIDVEKIIIKHVGLAEYEKWHLIKMFQLIKPNNPKAACSLELAYELYCKGYYFLESLGLGYGLSVRVTPAGYSKEYFVDLPENQQIRLIETLFPGAEIEAERVINWLETGIVTFVDSINDYGQLNYVDNRAENDRVPTAYVCG